MLTYIKSSKQASPPLGSHRHSLLAAGVGDGVGAGVAVATGVSVGKTVGAATLSGATVGATKGVGAVAGLVQAAIANDRMPHTTHRILDMRFLPLRCAWL